MTNRLGIGDINVVALIKGRERYIFVYDDCEREREEVCRLFGRFASNGTLSFTWHDAVVLLEKVRQAKP